MTSLSLYLGVEESRARKPNTTIGPIAGAKVKELLKTWRNKLWERYLSSIIVLSFR